MQKTKLILLKQTLFLALILVTIYWTLIVYSKVNIYNAVSLFGLLLEPIIWLILIITLFVFTPLTVLYFWRLKKGGNLNILNKIFRIICAIMLIIFTIAFVLAVGEQIYYRPPRISFLANLWFTITYHLSWDYFSDLNFGFVNDVKQVLVFLPHIIVAVFLFLAYKTNKLIGVKNEEKEGN